MRGVGHILYLVGRISDSKAKNLDSEITEELRSIQLHWNAIGTKPVGMSNASWENTQTLAGLLLTLMHEIPSMEKNTQIESLRSFADRTMQLVANLDREFIGLRESDAGYDL